MKRTNYAGDTNEQQVAQKHIRISLLCNVSMNTCLDDRASRVGIL